MLTPFFTILAWVFGTTSTLLLLFRIIGYFIYTDLDKNIDEIKGIRRTFPITKPFIVSVISWAWILSL